MDGCTIPPLRLRRFEASDVQEHHIYIMRGLKVVPERCWNDVTWKWEPRTDVQKATECDFRTAAEDVTHVPEIKAFFPEMQARLKRPQAKAVVTRP